MAQKIPYGTSHLDGRALATQRESTHNADEATQKFYTYQSEGTVTSDPEQHSLEMGNASASGGRLNPGDEQSRTDCCNRGSQKDQPKPIPLCVMQQLNRLIANRDRGIEREVEGNGYDA